MSEMVLLGDEAVAMGAIHAGITAAYAYPGTPSTEITEFLIRYSQKNQKPVAQWCANEKTAYEAALGVSFSGRRALVSMKHVGLNVAADPFMNSAIVNIHGGLVLVVADDPGMHSSQNEQDSRYYADFARIMCLEPTNQQEAYEMAKEAFELSERFHIPVMIRLVTRLAHSRAVVHVDGQREENPLQKVPDPNSWILLPSNAKKQWHQLLETQKDLERHSEESKHNPLELNPNFTDYGIITTGLGRNYYLENLPEIEPKPSHLHISEYPIPVEKVRTLAAHVKKLIIIEEGYPFVERFIRGILPLPIEIAGKVTGEIPAEGELTPDNIRPALGLKVREHKGVVHFNLPNRPPQLCPGCPHADTFMSLKKAMAEFQETMVTSDIGCYTLGALPPYNAIESTVNMGASVGMAKGAADAGFYPVVAVIGDSTFLHSGVTPLMDAVAHNTNMTLIILDNETVGMTGGQPTILPYSKLKDVVLGIGVDPAHVHVVTTHRKFIDQNAQIILDEVKYNGLSVVIAVRECVETAKRHKKEQKKA
ncbi:indolepyruvate ferredoxin oxidoreductase [candidate division KSB1 bacterium]|nr:MAG: indolepyruvate ferredoxin oxidoreductase [candidate division KSB1 bacterium]